MVDELAQESQYLLKVNVYFYSSFYDRHLKTLSSKIRHLK